MSNNNIVASVTRAGRYEPFDLQVSRGQIMGHTPVYIFGYSTAIGSTALGPVWEGQTQSGGLYTYPSSAVVMSIVSDSTSDSASKSILINGLDSGYNLQSETIALNGTTTVTSTKSYLRINNIAMTNALNTGNITVSNGGITYAKINAGIGTTQMSIYTVPVGYSYYLTYIQSDASVGFTSSNYMLFAEYNKFNSTGAVTYAGQSTFVQTYNQPFTVPVAHPEKTDIQYLVKSNSGGPFTSNIFAGGYLIPNNNNVNPATP
jgi:hypothetical protein